MWTSIKYDNETQISVLYLNLLVIVHHQSISKLLLIKQQKQLLDSIKYDKQLNHSELCMMIHIHILLCWPWCLSVERDLSWSPLMKELYPCLAIISFVVLFTAFFFMKKSAKDGNVTSLKINGWELNVLLL